MEASLQEYGLSAHHIQQHYCLEKHLLRHMQHPKYLSTLLDFLLIRSYKIHCCPQDATGGMAVPLPVLQLQPHLLLPTEGA